MGERERPILGAERQEEEEDEMGRRRKERRVGRM